MAGLGVVILTVIIAGFSRLGRLTAEHHTVTFVVTGGPAVVHYGSAQDDLRSGTPLHKTLQVTGVYTYMISATPSGPGILQCQIQVDGRVLATDKALAGGDTVSCDILRASLAAPWKGLNS